MIYALLDRNTDIAIREAIAQAIQNRNAAILRQYADQGIIRHIRDIQPGERFALYCIYCVDGVGASPGNRPIREKLPRGSTPWYFMHKNNANCLGKWCNLGNGTYLNPKRQGCYLQLGCLETHPRTACCVRQAGHSYCHHAFSIICPC